MRTAEINLESVTPLSQSRFVTDPKRPKESNDEHDARIWPERLHCDEHDMVFIPGMAFHKALCTAASKVNRRIPGKGMQTYGSRFKGGVFVDGNIPLGIPKADIGCELLLMSGTGKAGTGTRVPRRYPVIPNWTGSVSVVVADDAISKEFFEEALSAAGLFVGMGRWRPEVGGQKGRFRATNIKWSD